VDDTHTDLSPVHTCVPYQSIRKFCEHKLLVFNEIAWHTRRSRLHRGRSAGLVFASNREENISLAIVNFIVNKLHYISNFARCVRQTTSILVPLVYCLEDVLPLLRCWRIQIICSVQKPPLCRSLKLTVGGLCVVCLKVR
jgi:hypothetical protein